MSFYVKRVLDGRIGWTGPIRSERQAGLEAEAWRSEGRTTEVFPSTPEVRKQVREWERSKLVAAK